MRSSPVDKDAFANEAAPLRQLFTKSIVASMDLPEGTVLEEKHLSLKKPGTGLSAERLMSLLGGRLVRAVHADEQIYDQDVQSPKE
jgi:N,N'-diacetyllegionaminate synthase